jgi:ABC-type dipeptide/oligopeptide/nickel transport system permease component
VHGTKEFALAFVVKRISSALITLFLVSVFSFLAFSVIPGDPASLALGTEATPEQLASLRHEMGIDHSVPVRYLQWLGSFVSGNPGNSLRFRGEAVSALVLERLPVSFTLAALSLVFVLIIALVVSLSGARRENGFFEKIVNIIVTAGVGIPNFFLGVLFIWVFGIMLRFFTAGAYIDYRESMAGFISCLFFPALAIALPNAAILVKFLRASLIKEQQSDYFRTALSKGASHWTALIRHALRNAVIPSITVLGMIVAEVLSGSIVIEQVFAIPGIGRLLIAGISSRDYPLIQALVVYIASVVIIANTLVDIAIMAVDPRIKLEGDARK